MDEQENQIRKKIGILGGSFDPIHNGHLAIAQSAYQDFQLDEVWLIPAGHSPNKEASKMTPAEIRFQMTELAVLPYENLKASDIELTLEETSYTYRTLELLKANNPDYEFFFIMGADSLDYFEKWYHPERICQCAVILVAVRDEFSQKQVSEKIKQITSLFPADIRILSVARVDISSSEIRKQIAAHEDVSDKLPNAVRKFIEEQKLYQDHELHDSYF